MGRKLRKQVSLCMVEHEMLTEGDHVMVGLSGGKDSLALLHLLAMVQKKVPFTFKISAVTVDGGLLGLDATALEKQCAQLGVDFHLEKTPIFQIVSEKKDEGSTFCSMCAKMRRGTLYSLAKRLGASKIALGHHFDDALETLLMNMFYSGKMAALPPVLMSNAGHVPVIRPLLYCFEDDIKAYAKQKQFVTVGCACPICPIHPEFDGNLDLTRVKVKAWVKEIKKSVPGMHFSARRALKNLVPERFLAPLSSPVTLDEPAVKKLDSLLPLANI